MPLLPGAVTMTSPSLTAFICEGAVIALIIPGATQGIQASFT